MRTRISCPDRLALEQLLAGSPTDPPAEVLFAHIEQCPACTNTLHDLDRDDTLAALVRAGAMPPTESVAVEPLVRRILDHSRDGPGADRTVTNPATSPAADDSDALALLDAPQAAGELGRLGGYRVLALLGQGGMGAVFQAEDPRLGRMVALKVMLPGIARKPGMKDRFLREARAAAALDHDHVVPIYEVNEANGVPYIAMPFLKGGTLAERLTEVSGPVSAEEVRTVGRQVAAGLAAAHATGMVHRDIKPANVWLDAAAGGRVKILDFGLARRDTDDQLTHTGSVLGTPSFMAPEQARGEAVDGRADLFSLGVVLYRMAAGRLPFRGDSTLAVLSALANDTPTPIRELNPRVPPPLADLIHRLLAKTSADRQESAERVIAELDGLELAPSPVSIPPHRPKRRWALAAGVVTAVLVFAGISFGVYKFTVQTEAGTLVVDVDEAADVRFRKGNLEVYDAAGKLKYTLSPSEKNKALPPGKYLLKVIGADGVKLETTEFEMSKDGRQTVRVTAEPLKVAAAAPDFRSETAFPGKAVFRDTFETAEQCRLPLKDAPPVQFAVKDRLYRMANSTAKADELMAVDVEPRVKTGAMAVRTRVENGVVFINFRERRNREVDLQWHTVSISAVGEARVVLHRMTWDKDRWANRRVAVLQAAKVDPALAEGQWVTVAARWSETDYVVWVNGRRLAGGAADPAPVSATTGPIQLCTRAGSAGATKLELEYLTVWDQAGLKAADVDPMK